MVPDIYALNEDGRKLRDGRWGVVYTIMSFNHRFGLWHILGRFHSARIDIGGVRSPRYGLGIRTLICSHWRIHTSEGDVEL